MEYGLPTDTRNDELKSTSFLVLNYTLEKIWSNWGLAAGTGISNYNIANSLDDTEFAMRAGVLGIFLERVFGDIFYSRTGDQSFVEASAELIVSRKSSLDFYLALD